MKDAWYFLLFFSWTITFLTTGIPAIHSKLATTFVVVFVRDRTSILPYFLTLFSRIEYPKDRMRIWIYRNSHDDNSASLIDTWVKTWSSQYHSIDIKSDNTTDTEKLFSTSTTEARYRRIIKLREEALVTARLSRANYIWFLDCDALLTDSQTLISLIRHDLIVAAPMLHSDEMYSNFWCGMTSSYYYKRTDEYEEILYRKKIGCFPVPMVNGAVLINLRNHLSDKLTFDPERIVDYDGPIDDIIAFAVGANKSGVPLYVCNDRKYGYTIVPADEMPTGANDKHQLLNLKLYITVDNSPLDVDDVFSAFISLPPKMKFGFDEIFVINLKRRSERRARMKYCLDELGIDAKFIEAVDGKSLGDEELISMGVTLMPNYEDPYHKRPMKKGEIGCFLSHYKIWREVIRCYSTFTKHKSNC